MSTTARLLLFSLLPVAFLLFACTDPAAKLPNYGTVPPFTMTDSQGHSFDKSALLGKVWVVDFIYTNCPAECPMMTSRMHKVAQQMKGQSDVGLLSISVDPQRDSPPVLNEFAHRFGGPTNQWHFLTGTPGTVHLLAYNTFHVGDVIGKIEHSTKFIVLDKRANIRGYYSSFDQDGIPAMLKDVAALRRERS